MKEKAIILDSGTIINFSLNSLLDLLEDLEKAFHGKFLITEDIRFEVVKRPLKIKKFELGALRIQQLLKKKIIHLPSYLGIDHKQIESRTRELLKLSNHTYMAKNKYLHLIDKGEASCLALSEILTRKGIKNVISIDERTTRMLCEGPENLRKLLENKLHTPVKVKKQNFPEFSKFKVIRSTELGYIAYKKGLIKIGNGNLLDALLYAIKFKGCSVSREEIEEMKRL